MTVSFEIDLPNGETVTEAELSRAAGEKAAFLAAIDSLQGGIVLADPVTGESTAVGDVLGALINSLCFQSIPVLAANQVYSSRLFAYPEQVSMTPEGDDVMVTGDELDPARYSKRELLPALVACGERYAAYLRKTRGDNPEWTGRLEMLEAAAKAARAQLPSAA